jgi:hypothetical protein
LLMFASWARFTFVGRVSGPAPPCSIYVSICFWIACS